MPSRWHIPPAKKVLLIADTCIINPDWLPVYPRAVIASEAQQSRGVMSYYVFDVTLRCHPDALEGHAPQRAYPTRKKSSSHSRHLYNQPRLDSLQYTQGPPLNCNRDIESTRSARVPKGIIAREAGNPEVLVLLCFRCHPDALEGHIPPAKKVLLIADTCIINPDWLLFGRASPLKI